MSVETVRSYAGSFIGGDEHANAGDPLAVVNPADGQAFASIAAATDTDVDAAVRSARSAFDDWSTLAVSKRGETLRRAAGHVEAHLDELIVRHQLGEQVKIIGRVSDAELFGWYRAANVYVSLSAHEGFGAERNLAVLECVASS